MTDKAKPVKLPSTGGSYVIGKDGKPVLKARTLGPLDPMHEANRPPPAAPAAKTPKES